MQTNPPVGEPLTNVIRLANHLIDQENQQPSGKPLSLAAWSTIAIENSIKGVFDKLYATTGYGSGNPDLVDQIFPLFEKHPYSSWMLAYRHPKDSLAIKNDVEQFKIDDINMLVTCWFVFHFPNDCNIGGMDPNVIHRYVQGTYSNNACELLERLDHKLGHTPGATAQFAGIQAEHAPKRIADLLRHGNLPPREFETNFAENKDNIVVLEGLADQAWREQDYDSALRVQTQIVRLAPNNDRILALAQTQLWLGDEAAWEQTLHRLDQSWNQSESPAIPRLMARSLMLAGRHEAALSHAEEASRRSFYGTAIVLAHAQMFTDQVDAATRTIRRYADSNWDEPIAALFFIRHNRDDLATVEWETRIKPKYQKEMSPSEWLDLELEWLLISGQHSEMVKQIQSSDIPTILHQNPRRLLHGAMVAGNLGKRDLQKQWLRRVAEATHAKPEDQAAAVLFLHILDHGIDQGMVRQWQHNHHLSDSYVAIYMVWLMNGSPKTPYQTNFEEATGRYTTGRIFSVAQRLGRQQGLFTGSTPFTWMGDDTHTFAP